MGGKPLRGCAPKHSAERRQLGGPKGARKHGLRVTEVEECKERLLLGAENALRSRPRDEEALENEQSKRPEQKIGELVLNLDISRTAQAPPRGPEDVRPAGRGIPRLGSVGFVGLWPYHAARPGPGGEAGAPSAESGRGARSTAAPTQSVLTQLR